MGHATTLGFLATSHCCTSEHRLTMCLTWLLLVCCWAGVAVWARPSSTDTDMRYIRTCNDTSPVSLATVNQVLVYRSLSEGAQHDHRSFQCFLHCLFTKYGWMDEEGGFLLAEMRRVLQETLEEAAVLHQVLYECTALRQRDPCRRALLFTTCFWQRLEQHPQLQQDDYNSYKVHDEDDLQAQFQIWRR